jgi:hypothetical protein
MLIRDFGYRRETETKTRSKGNGEDRQDGKRKKYDWGKFGNLINHDDSVSISMAFAKTGMQREACRNLLRSGSRQSKPLTPKAQRGSNGG